MALCAGMSFLHAIRIFGRFALKKASARRRALQIDHRVKTDNKSHSVTFSFTFECCETVDAFEVCDDRLRCKVRVMLAPPYHSSTAAAQHSKDLRSVLMAYWPGGPSVGPGGHPCPFAEMLRVARRVTRSQQHAPLTGRTIKHDNGA